MSKRRNRGRGSRRPERQGSKRSRRDLTTWERALAVVGALVTIGAVAYQSVFGGESGVLVLTAEAPQDRVSHIQCNGHGEVDPPEEKPKVLVSVACQQLVEGEWKDVPEKPPAEDCEKCLGLRAQHTVSCDSLGDGPHEIRTQVHGYFEDDDGYHEPDPVESEVTIDVRC